MMNFIAIFFPAAPDARVLAATVQSKALADMLANDASKVAQVYPWVADLRASQIPDSEIVKAMIETENVTWMEGALNLEAENYGWRETPERRETPRHLDHLEHGCVHPPRLIESSQRIPSDLHEPESSWLEKTVDAFTVFAQREQVALKHCGIGGVLHPGVLIGNNYGLVSFQGDGASVVYGDEINDTDRTWTHHGGPLESLNTIPFRTVRPWLGGPAEWIQYARGGASWSLSPLDFQWKSN